MPLEALPVLNRSDPLDPADPAFAVLRNTIPLEDKVLSPLATVSEPPVCTVL